MCTASASCCRRYSIETPSFSTATSRQKVGRRIVNLDSSSCCFGFSRQWAPPRIVLHLFLRSSSSFITTVTAMSSLAASKHLILRIPLTFSLAVPCSQSFCQYTHHRSSVQVQTTSVVCGSSLLITPMEIDRRHGCNGGWGKSRHTSMRLWLRWLCQKGEKC